MRHSDRIWLVHGMFGSPGDGDDGSGLLHVQRFDRDWL